jgi:polar amino acid transport system permease protein
MIRIPGAEPSSRLDPWWWLVGAVAALLVLMMVLKPDPYWKILLFVRDGLGITALLTVVSFVFILLVGLIGGLGRIAKNPFIHLIASLYVEIIRGIPLLVQLIWWYFAAPVVIQTVGRAIHFSAMANYHANAIFLAIVGLVICYGAYMAEIFRAGIESIPKGQMEAARSLGMTYMQSMRNVILPQAFRVVLPPIGNEFIMLIKDTSLVSVVAVADLTRRGREYMAAHFNPIETWTLVALLYLIMTLFSARLIAWLEKRRRY